MNNGGDAAEQIVRLSLEGFEVAVKLTGSAAKNIAILLASVLKQEISQSNKTRGKASRISSRQRTGFRNSRKNGRRSRFKNRRRRQLHEKASVRVSRRWNSRRRQ